MSWFPLDHDPNLPALVDGDLETILSYGQLKKQSEEFGNQTPSTRTFVFLFCKNTTADIIAYIGCLNRTHAVCLLDGDLDETIKLNLVEHWKPFLVIDSLLKSLAGYEKSTHFFIREDSNPAFPSLHPDLQLLLTTSGTTGNPKLIRLSQANILSNAHSIASYLSLTYADRAVWALPFHYSFGLSILHTHLLVGGSLIVTKRSLIEEAFWNIVKKWNGTSLSGVPYSYKLMDRIGFEWLELPTLKTLTQAGGRLETPLVIKYDEIMKNRKGRFFVMYGQTEATARMSYIPPPFLPRKAGTIGKAIPGGHLKIFQNGLEVTSPHEIGELVYQGPNVMMGYAADQDDLKKGDELKGVLHTEDIGFFDEDQFFTLTGRLKRISKIYGLRINLDDIEKALSPYGSVAATSTDAEIHLYCEAGEETSIRENLKVLANMFQLHPTTFVLVPLPDLPRTASGKIDYKALK